MLSPNIYLKALHASCKPTLGWRGKKTAQFPNEKVARTFQLLKAPFGEMDRHCSTSNEALIFLVSHSSLLESLTFNLESSHGKTPFHCA